jgi:dTDP-4-dehydrorhamnose 3,5-epimerase|tara:strand:+ start:979 stop:1542 length:564 start_codon:yes stop_codon:yes gene_type:complete
VNRFTVSALPLSGLNKITRQALGDRRGYLSRLFCKDELRHAGWTKPIAQINHTYTQKKGVVRGMHFQYPPHEEMKLISCIRGEVWDVAVDLRKHSPTFLHWHAERLSADNLCAVVIPEGFAHGFQTLSEDCELLYSHSAPYSAESESGLNILDPLLKIEWPLSISDASERDTNLPMISSSYEGMTIL